MPRKSLLLLTCLATAVVTVAGAIAFSQAREPEHAGALGPNSVVNGQVAAGLTGWTADSAAGPVKLTRVALAGGPDGAASAVDLRRDGGKGDWALALAKLDAPDTFFRVGQQYVMQAYVRDVNASGQEIGLLLANSNYRNRPTESSNYASFHDDGWHRLTATFVASANAGSDTALYLALPTSGPLHWQVTAAGVREIQSHPPTYAVTPPSKVISFDGPAGSDLNATVWNHELGGRGWGHNEQQTYTASAANSHLDGQGHLVIATRREDQTGADGIPRHYTSARVTTQGKVAVQPGSYLEASIQAPVGPNMWPAFWLLGTNFSDVGWPAAGELDVLEARADQPSVAQSQVHMARESNPAVDFVAADGGATDLGHPLDSQPHTYGVYFDGTVVKFFVDRRQTAVITASDARAAGARWPFGGAQFLILNAAVDGNPVPADAPFPQHMTVGPIGIWASGIPF